MTYATDMTQTKKVGKLYQMDPYPIHKIKLQFAVPLAIEYLVLFVANETAVIHVINDLGDEFSTELNLFGSTGIVSFRDKSFLTQFKLVGDSKTAAIQDLEVRVRTNSKYQTILILGNHLKTLLSEFQKSQLISLNQRKSQISKTIPNLGQSSNNTNDHLELYMIGYMI